MTCRLPRRTRVCNPNQVLDLARADTVCALATPPGRGALAVIRVSGARAFAVRDVVFRRRRLSSSPPPGMAVLGDIIDPVRGDVLDEALVMSFRSPRSFTGEDVVEFSLHGAPLVVELVLRLLVHAGCRPASPGEFTLRAVLTGRLDLARAEAVDAVIGARSVAALHAAQRALRGGLATALTPPRDALIDVLAELEARLDFPDEPLGDADRGRLHATLEHSHAGLVRLLGGAPRGRHLVEGARVVLYGAPNAGKSTLLNSLAGHERALVHDAPGTTRDMLEAAVEIAGIPCVVVDVAGVRDDDDGAPLHPVERAGIVRARQEVARADVVLALAPPGAPFLAVPVEAAVLRVRSKGDLPGVTAEGADITVSAATGEGLDALRARLAQLLGVVGVDDTEVMIQTARQQRALQQAVTALEAASRAFVDGAPDEITCSELRRSALALDEVLGRDVGQDVLDLVFSRFCIGK
jgi:tRNA modification GTPase